jgi:electron transport complex protein RnfC
LESEPYLRSELCLLRDKGNEVLEGLAIIASLATPERVVIAVDPDGAGAAEAALASRPDGESRPEIVRLARRYPQDLGGQLLDALHAHRGRGAPAAMIFNASTLFAVYEAIVLAKPMIDRFVTVAGGAVKRPSVLKARLGTPIGDLIEECGGFLGPPARLILGGPFRGHAVNDLDAPITKMTPAVLALTVREVGRALRSPCIRCGRCAAACPEQLDPDLLFRLLERRLLLEARAEGLERCTLCGACGYTCPSRVPLVAAFAASDRGVSPAHEARERRETRARVGRRP